MTLSVIKIKTVPIPRQSPVERNKEHQKRTSKLNQVFEQSDFIKSFDEISNYSQKITLSKFWEVKIVSGLKIYFYSLDLTNNSINIVNQVSVDRNMKVKVFLKGNELAYNDLKWIVPLEMKLSRWSQLENLLSRDQFIQCESNESATQKALAFLKTSVNFLNKALSLLNFETSENDSQSHNLNAEDNNL